MLLKPLILLQSILTNFKKVIFLQQLAPLTPAPPPPKRKKIGDITYICLFSSKISIRRSKKWPGKAPQRGWVCSFHIVCQLPGGLHWWEEWLPIILMGIWNIHHVVYLLKTVLILVAGSTLKVLSLIRHFINDHHGRCAMATQALNIWPSFHDVYCPHPMEMMGASMSYTSSWPSPLRSWLNQSGKMTP